uniref:Galactosyltransferase N-terminal domain-containing protein n=1 Tax=Parascaris equorum TaxID=6256 RepID=A0A914RB57_PAREQ
MGKCSIDIAVNAVVFAVFLQNLQYIALFQLGCDYLVMHDVDLLPLNINLSYSYPGIGVVRHISSPQYHPKNYEKIMFRNGMDEKRLTVIHDVSLV